MKLYLIHTGFYDPELMGGLYEQHTNYFVVASNIQEAKKKAKKNIVYNKKKMHVDGIQEINVVDGYRIKLEEENSENDAVSYSYDDIKNLSE